MTTTLTTIGSVLGIFVLSLIGIKQEPIVYQETLTYETHYSTELNCPEQNYDCAVFDEIRIKDVIKDKLAVLTKARYATADIMLTVEFSDTNKQIGSISLWNNTANMLLERKSFTSSITNVYLQKLFAGETIDMYPVIQAKANIIKRNNDQPIAYVVKLYVTYRYYGWYETYLANIVK